MTMNYKIAEIEVAPVPLRYKSKSKEEREKEAEERGVELHKVAGSIPDPTPIKTTIDWVSHGNYAIYQPDPDKKEDDFFPWIYIHLEQEYFDQIIEAFEAVKSQEPPTDHYEYFNPFWTANMPARGMMPIATQLKAFRASDSEAFVIQEHILNPFTAIPACKLRQLGFTLEDFKKIREISLGATNKPIHYCQMEL